MRLPGFLGTQQCPNEEDLRQTWPALRQSLQSAAKYWTASPGPNPKVSLVPVVSLASIEVPITSSHLPGWRRIRLAA